LHMTKNDLPIGFFDSGVGGLSVLCHAVSRMPRENFIYFGDSANAPYGTKSEEEIKELSMDCGEFLYQKGVKAMVMACNTATSASVIRMREKYQMPVISIEPAVKPAAESRNPGQILVMATPATITGQRYQGLVDKVGCRDRILDLPCGGLVEMLESGEFQNPDIEVYIREKFGRIAGKTIGAIVIGCTHYSFVVDTIYGIARELLAGKCEIFDGMYGTVRQLQRILREDGLENTGGCGSVELCSSGDQHSLAVYRRILEEHIG